MELRIFDCAEDAALARYRKALKIALRWIKNYTDLDFRSLGSYTRADLERIAGGDSVAVVFINGRPCTSSNARTQKRSRPSTIRIGSRRPPPSSPITAGRCAA